VNGLDLSESDLLRIATSVKADPAQTRAPLRLGWLPTGTTVVHTSVVGNSPTNWQATLDCTLPNSDGSPTSSSAKPTATGLRVSLGPTTTAPAGGEALTVGEHAARLVALAPSLGFTRRYLVVDLGAGQLLTLDQGWTGPSEPSRADLVRIAERVTLGTPAETAWIGTP
jgi:hypothetical protein